MKYSKGETMKNLITICIITVYLSICVILPAFAGTWRDDFEDNIIREWKIFNPNRQVEKWWINDNEVVGEIFLAGFWSLWLTGDLKWEHYSVSCRAKLVDHRDQRPSVGSTLYNRGEERGGYGFYIEFLLGFAVIEKWVPNGGFVMFPFVAEKDIWYELTATVHEDGTLEFRINDEVFTAFDPNPLPGGQAGLIVTNGRARFDDVEITGENIPNGGPGRQTLRAVAPEAKLATTWGKLKMK